MLALIFLLGLFVYWVVYLDGGFKVDRRINIILDKNYDNIWDMSLAVIVHLENEGKKCSLLEPKKGAYPRIIVDGELYYMTYELDLAYIFPIQKIYLNEDKIKY